MMKLLPLPTSEVKEIWPWCILMISEASASPSPIPPSLVEKKGSKIRLRWAG